MKAEFKISSIVRQPGKTVATVRFYRIVRVNPAKGKDRGESVDREPLGEAQITLGLDATHERIEREVARLMRGRNFDPIDLQAARIERASKHPRLEKQERERERAEKQERERAAKPPEPPKDEEPPKPAEPPKEQEKDSGRDKRPR